MENALPEEEVAIQALVREVDGLPLGLRILAAQMDLRDRSATDFLKFFKANARRILTKAPIVEYYDKDKDRKVGSVHILDHVWLLSFERLTPEAISLIGILSLLSPDLVPRNLFSAEAVEGKPEPPDFEICRDEFE